MQSLNDDERKEVMGDILADELQAIREYVQDVPLIKQELHHVAAAVETISGHLSVISTVVKDHESVLQKLNQKIA
jgi:hypothetical protein